MEQKSIISCLVRALTKLGWEHPVGGVDNLPDGMREINIYGRIIKHGKALPLALAGLLLRH
jgi:hypothetical protein